MMTYAAFSDNPTRVVLRYAAVGVLNTAVSYILIVILMASGINEYIANASGYAVGLLFSFFSNRYFTFGRKGPVQYKEFTRFLACFAVSYAINIAFIALARSVGIINHPLSHLGGMFVYSLSFFILMKSFVFIGDNDRKSLYLYVKNNSPQITVGVLSLILFTWLSLSSLPHDVMWQFWIARQLNAGMVLYRDIWEVNPPLWFWSAMPVEKLGALLGVAPYPLWTAIVIMIGAFGAIMAGRLGGFTTLRQRWIVTVSLFLIMIAYPAGDFAQRDQLAAICAIPYAVLITRRRQQQPVHLLLAVIIGLLAAYGFALKHYFVAVPILLEIWLGRGRNWRWEIIRPETLVMAACGVIYASAVLIFSPDFLRLIVPMVKLAYFGYQEPLVKSFDEPSQLIWIAAIAALWRAKKVFSSEANPLCSALLICAGCFAFSYFAQMKGWQYQAHPVTICLLSALVVRVSTSEPDWVKRHAIAIFAFAYAFSVSMAMGPYVNGLRLRSEPLLSLAKKGESVAVLAADPIYAWPIIEERGLKWPLHYYSLWMLPAIAYGETAPEQNHDLARLGQTVRERTLADLECHLPKVILIERHRAYPVQPLNFDVTRFFLKDPAFGRFIASRYSEQIGNWHFRVFTSNGSFAPQERPGCINAAAPDYTIQRYDYRGRRVDGSGSI